MSTYVHVHKLWGLRIAAELLHKPLKHQSQSNRDGLLNATPQDWLNRDTFLARELNYDIELGSYRVCKKKKSILLIINLTDETDCSQMFMM